MASSEILQREQGSGIRYRAIGPAAPTALLVLLHGVGGNEGNLADLASGLDPNLLCVLPRGPLALGPGGFAWFEVAFGAQGPVIRADQAEAGRLQLAGLVAGLQGETGIGPDRTVVAGFSQGGIMSAGLGLTRPDLVTGFGLLSGRILPEIAPHLADRTALKRIHALIAHGLQDQVLPSAWAERSEAWLRDLGVAFQSRRYPGGHEIPPAMAGDFQAWVRERLR